MMLAHKRKRSIDDIHGLGGGWGSKRRPITALPIRSSPATRPSISITPAFSAFSQVSQTPTSVETSEDESYEQYSRHLNAGAVPDAAMADAQSSTNTSSSSLRVEVDQSVDDNMDLMPVSPTRTRIGRARSNDLVSPRRALGALSPSPFAEQGRERVPTPISQNFSGPEFGGPPKGRPAPLRTVLTPMLDEEEWSRNGGFLSPAGNEHHDAGMMVDQASDSMTGLNMGNEHEMSDYMNDRDNQAYDAHGHVEQDHSRAARLVMGYRSDCEKCAQRVPGHYSHIIWS